MVLGGTKGVLNTAFGDAMTPAFANPPKCMLHRQGNFATTFYPKNVQADLDNQVGIYVFPKFEGGYDGAAILGGGDLAALFNGNDTDAKKVMAVPHLRQVRRPVGQGRRLALAAQDVRREQLPQRDDQARSPTSPTRPASCASTAPT